MQGSSQVFVGGTTPAKKKNKKISKKNWMIIFIVVISVLALVASYIIGYNSGKKDQKAIDDKKVKTTSAVNTELPDIIKNRWSIVGTVESVSADSITVKNNKGLVQTATVNDKTSITEKNAKKTTIDAVKKDSSVIIIGTKDDNNKYTASMIRIKT
jgi:hypothetical protein